MRKLYKGENNQKDLDEEKCRASILMPDFMKEVNRTRQCSRKPICWGLGLCWQHFKNSDLRNERIGPNGEIKS